jgi:hypothetical protein
LAFDSTKAAGDLVTSSDYNTRTVVIKKNPTTVSVPETRLNDGDFLVLSREVLDAGDRLNIHAAGVDPSGVTGLQIKIRNITDGSDVFTENGDTNYGPDLVEAAAAGDQFEVRLENISGSRQDVKGFCKYEVSSE